MCRTHIQKHTYIKDAGFAEFIFDALIKVQDLDDRNCLNRLFLDSLPYSGKIKQKLVIDYIRNGYITCQNILAVAKSRNRKMIEIGGNRKSRAKRAKLSDSCAGAAAY